MLLHVDRIRVHTSLQATADDIARKKKNVTDWSLSWGVEDSTKASL